MTKVSRIRTRETLQPAHTQSDARRCYAAHTTALSEVIMQTIPNRVLLSACVFACCGLVADAADRVRAGQWDSVARKVGRRMQVVRLTLRVPRPVPRLTTRAGRGYTRGTGSRRHPLQEKARLCHRRTPGPRPTPGARIRARSSSNKPRSCW